MLYYGYAIDHKGDSEKFEKFSSFRESEELEVFFPYSVSAFEPSICVYGVRVMGGSSLFDAISLDSVNQEAKGFDKEHFDCPEELQESLIDEHQTSPKFYIWENSDD